jgi:hypothetical protein
MNILIYTLRAIAYALTEPYLILFLAILAFMLYRQNKKTTVMQRMIMGESLISPFELTISQVVIGIFAGTAASLIMSYLGIVFDENSSVDLIFLISIIFMYVSPRFMCFAYSGASLGLLSIILSQLSVILKVPNLNFLKIDVVALMTMVAILHFIEGFLTIIDGDTGYIPVFTSRNNKIIGGFAFQRYWVMPVALLIMLSSKSIISGATVPMPSWWPLIKTSIPGSVLRDAIEILIPFYGVIGYTSITFTKTKTEKVTSSGISIIIYSIVLFILAQLSVINIYFKFLVLIFAPAAHEFMLNYESSLEFTRKSKYVSDDEGIVVLDVIPKSPAFEMGLESGDKILEINGREIYEDDEIMNQLRDFTNFVELKVKKSNNIIEELNYNHLNNTKRLGIVFVPRNLPKGSTIVKLENNKFQDILDKIKKKNKDD